MREERQGCKYLIASIVMRFLTIKIDAAGNQRKKYTGAFPFNYAICLSFQIDLRQFYK